MRVGNIKIRTDQVEHNRDDGEDRNGLCKKRRQDDEPFLLTRCPYGCRLARKGQRYGNESRKDDMLTCTDETSLCACSQERFYDHISRGCVE